MRASDYGAVCILVFLAGFIWSRDLSWLSAASDTLPILVGLPLFVWFKRPWAFTDTTQRWDSRPVFFAATLFLFGLLTDSTFLLAIAWTVFLGSWIAFRFEEAGGSLTRKLLVLPFVSFPWLVNDFDRIGWWFRLSGAAMAEKLFAWTPMSITRHGTDLCVGNFNLSVEPACSGLNGLQSMLIAGAILAFLKLKDTKLYWWNLPLLVAAAWLANTLRIIFAIFCAAFFSESVMKHWLQPLHLAAGWFALCAMFGLCWVVFEIEASMARKLKIQRSTSGGVKTGRFGSKRPEKIQPLTDLENLNPIQNVHSADFKSTFRDYEVTANANADHRARLWRRMSRIAARCPTQQPWLEIFILGFCVWHCRDLLASWTNSPFDRAGGLAFLIWLTPILAVALTAQASSDSDLRKLGLMGAGSVLTFLGNIGELNFGEHLGLTLALAGFVPARAVVPCIASASVWWPASGWLASHAGFVPSLFAIVRLATALGLSWLVFSLIRWKPDTQNFENASEHQINF